MHQKSMQITCGRTDEYETWCLILTRRDECPSWLLPTESLFIWNLDGVLRTLPWRTYSWGDEDVNFHPLIFRYQIANSMLILFKAFCILQCAREFPQASEFENFLICLVLWITRNFHFYFAFKYSPLLFWGIIMAARSMFSCCRHEATSLVKRPPRSKKCAGSRNHLLSSNNTFRALYSRKKAFVKSPSNNDIMLRNHFLSSNNTFWAPYNRKKAFFKSPSNNDIMLRNHFLSSNNTFWALHSHK